MPDQMKMTVLPDGSIKSEVMGKISMPNHQSAADFLRTIAQLAGGKLKIASRHSHDPLSADHTHTQEQEQ